MALYIDGIEVLSDIVMHGTWTASGIVNITGVSQITMSGTEISRTVANSSVNLYGGLTTAGKSARFFMCGVDNGVYPGGWVVQTGNAATTADLTRLYVTGNVDTAAVTFSNCTVDLGASCEADLYTVGGVSGIDESGSGTITTFTITVVKGIVTAFGKVS